MNSLIVLRRHSSALQFAAACVLTSLAVIGLPLFAENSTSVPSTAYGDYIVRRFQKTGAETAQSFDNRYVETNAFDFAAYFSHTCFRPTEYDMAACEREFGPYANLKDTLTSGQLGGILTRYKYLSGAEKAVTPEPVTKTNEPKPSVYVAPQQTNIEASAIQKERDVRAKQIWAVCQKRSSDRSEAGRCYRRNVRLLSQESWTLDVESNVY
ncbi:MAG TPA: hypothetical protein PKV72_05620 [Candidatus Peribacteria bacterium]|nr:hypothetical protein [Candidatus Peribacteria bacterium]